MLRASFIVLLTCICAPAMAQNGRVLSTVSASACQEIADKANEASPPSEAATRARQVCARDHVIVRRHAAGGGQSWRRRRG